MNSAVVAQRLTSHEKRELERKRSALEPTGGLAERWRYET